MPRRLGIPLVAGDCGIGCMPTTSVNDIRRYLGEKNKRARVEIGNENIPFPPTLIMLDRLVSLLSPTFLIASSIILATVYLLKVFRPGALAPLLLHLILPPALVGRAKPLDPNVWKEFPLDKKIQVSPNTAMYAFYHVFKSPLFILF